MSITNDLRKLLEECKQSNWDGCSLTEESYNQASKFINLLPEKTINPDLSLEPNGDVVFEWYVSPINLFSVTVSGNNELYYAGIFDSEKLYGSILLQDSIPAVIIENIKRLGKI